MKITVTLSDAELKGIKNYLEECGDIYKPSAKDVKQYIEGIVIGTIHAPQEAVSVYISQQEQSEISKNGF